MYFMKVCGAILFAAVISFTSMANVEHFSRLPQYEDVTLSPTAKKIAFIENNQSHKASILRVFDREKKQMRALLNSDNKRVKINWFHWKTDAMLMVSIRYESKTPDGIRYYQTRLYSIDTNAKEIKKTEMFKFKVETEISNITYTSQFRDRVIDWLPDDPKQILMQADLDYPNRPDVYRVNIETGRQIKVTREQRKIRHWISDRQGKVRAGYAHDYETSEIVYWYRDNEDENLKALFKYNLYKDKPIEVLGFDANPNELYYTKYDGNYKALYKMDMTTRESTLIYKRDGYDLDGELIVSKKTRDVIGISDPHAPFFVHYFDDKHYELHRALENVIPDNYNYLIDTSDDELTYIMSSESDSSPLYYYLGDRKANALSGLFGTYPEVDKLTLPNHKRISFEARDGQKIEGYLTLPLTGTAPYPTVIHPHGGPGAREYAGFDSWTSFMTHKGYAVLRPNFRGSTGYGYEFSQAQMGGWGLEMQDDITDAANYLIKEGVADKERICIFGASYGGYAAMMATTKTPDLFTCAISFAGVSDLYQFKKDHSWTTQGDLLTDQQFGKSKSDLRARSPISHVEKVKTPLLVMHGHDDIVVDVDQSRAFVKSLRKNGKKVKYVEFEYGDHYLSIQENRNRFFLELEAFLNKHLGTSQ